MTNKAMKKSIKDKAYQVKVKDLSGAILEKLERTPVIEPVVSQRRFVFRLKPVYAFVLLIVIGLSFAFLSQPDTINPQITIEDYDQTLMTSVMSIAYAYDLSEEEELRLMSQTLDTSLIENEIEQLSKYFQLMENYLASEASFHMEVIPISGEGILRHLRFRTTDMVASDVIYDLIIKNERIIDVRILRINAQVILMDETYDLLINIDLDDKTKVDVTLVVHENRFLRTRHTLREGRSEFEVALIENNNTISQIRFSKNQADQYVDLHLERASAQGSYRFRITSENKLQVEYAIARQNLIETGQINIEIQELPDQARAYGIRIRPQGRPEIEIEPQVRPNPPIPPRNRPNVGPFAT